MALGRRVETFVAGYVGFLSESTSFSALPMQDLDSPAGKANFALTDRTKQYLDPTIVPTIQNAGVAVDPVANPYAIQYLGAMARFTTAFGTTPTLTMTGSYLPMYFLKGARALGNTRTANKIDTTGSGDTYMNGVPGRPDASITFSLVAGAKITNKAGKLVTIESMLLNAANAGQQVVFSFVDDTTDPLQPRDTMYCFVGTANKTRALNAAVERAITADLAVNDNVLLPLAPIDYIA